MTQKPKQKTQNQEERLFKIQTDWNFKKIYKNPNDPQIEKDIIAVEKAYSDFATKYNTREQIKNFTETSAGLYTALKDWSILMSQTGVIKPLWYLHLVCDLDSSNTKIKAIFSKFEQRALQSANQIVFFNLELAKITKEKQEKFLADPTLTEFKTYLSSIFEIAKYNLSEEGEKILSLKNTPAHSMWVDAQKKYLNSQTVLHKKKQIPITVAMAIKADLPLKERRALHIEISKKYKEISFFAEAELNAVVKNKTITDELRGFTKPYQATVLGYQNSIESVESLVNTVNFRKKDAHEFFKLKAKALGLKKLTIAEIGTKPSPSKKKYTPGEGVGMVYEAFKSIHTDYSEMFRSFVENGQIDFFPKDGKRNGAYCSGGIGVPTYIFLNHTDSYNSITTLAHEMGHAIHYEKSKVQSPLYEDFTISVAEVASTFFENVLFDYVYERSDPTEQKNMLLEKVQDNIFTIHFQICFFNFELELHKQIKEKGYLSAKEIADLFLAKRKEFLGPVFEYDENDGYSFVAIPHFRYFFYVYSYAYGQLIANSLYAEYKKDPKFLEKIELFLSAGGSKKPDQIFKDIGIDVTKPDFFSAGLDLVSEQIKQIKKIVK